MYLLGEKEGRGLMAPGRGKDINIFSGLTATLVLILILQEIRYVHHM